MGTSSLELQEGMNIERKAWRAQVSAISRLLKDHTNEKHYNMSAAEVVERLRVFANKRERRTRQRKGGG